jgi:hypothetical protein
MQTADGGGESPPDKKDVFVHSPTPALLVIGSFDQLTDGPATPHHSKDPLAQHANSNAHSTFITSAIYLVDYHPRRSGLLFLQQPFCKHISAKGSSNGYILVAACELWHTVFLRQLRQPGNDDKPADTVALAGPAPRQST